MKVKNIVQVMNFHALLRVDEAKRLANKYLELERQVTYMINEIEHNRNFILDKKVLLPNPNMPILKIYIGSDFGFCSNLNSQINHLLSQDKGILKIIIGKRLSHMHDDIAIRCSREQLESKMIEILQYVDSQLEVRAFSKIIMVYNHYENAGDIQLKERQIFPIIEAKTSDQLFLDDYVCEGDINELLLNLIKLYVHYEIKICCINSLASENVLRQDSTMESLKKIDEQEENITRDERKKKRQKEFSKLIDSYVKKNYQGRS